MNNRRFSRILFCNEAALEQDQQVFDTSVLDLSLKGALISRPAGWAGVVGSPGVLRFRLSQSELELVMEVIIAHTHDQTVGLKCERMDIDSASHLRRLLELNLGDADLLSRELSELSNHSAA